MADVNVLVVFYSRYGEAETLALAAGVGAIQANANIRLRRLADLADAATIGADPRWAQNLERMTRDYVPPREADPAWADVLVLVTSRHSPAEMEAFVSRLRAAGSLAGKIAAPIAAGSDERALRPLYAEAACAGMFIAPAAPAPSLDAVAWARACGRQGAAMARGLKAVRTGS